MGDYEKYSPKPVVQRRQWFLNTLCIANFMISALALSAAVLMYTNRRSRAGVQEQVLCVPCSQLRLSNDPLDDFTAGFKRTTEEGQEVCCAQNVTQTNLLINTLVENRMRIERTTNGYHVAMAAPLVSTKESNSTNRIPQTNVMAAFAYLSGPLTLAPNEQNMDFLREWEFDGDLTYRRAGINYDAKRGRFIIIESGLYLITCQVGFKAPIADDDGKSKRMTGDSSDTNDPMRPKGSSPAQVYSFHVARHNQEYRYDKEPEVLMAHREEEICETNSGYPCHTGLSAGTLRLRAGDEIYVYTNAKQLVLSEQQFTYLGIVRVS